MSDPVPKKRRWCPVHYGNIERPFGGELTDVQAELLRRCAPLLQSPFLRTVAEARDPCQGKQPTKAAGREDKRESHHRGRDRCTNTDGLRGQLGHKDALYVRVVKALARAVLHVARRAHTEQLIQHTLNCAHQLISATERMHAVQQ